MPSGLDAVLMDASVNSGPRASVRWVQRALRVKADGYLGPKTWTAIQNSDVETLIINSINERLKSVRGFRKYDVFGRGWENRIDSVEDLALELHDADDDLNPAVKPKLEPEPDVQEKLTWFQKLIQRLFRRNDE